MQVIEHKNIDFQTQFLNAPTEIQYLILNKLPNSAIVCLSMASKYFQQFDFITWVVKGNEFFQACQIGMKLDPHSLETVIAKYPGSATLIAIALTQGKTPFAVMGEHTKIAVLLERIHLNPEKSKDFLKEALALSVKILYPSDRATQLCIIGKSIIQFDPKCAKKCFKESQSLIANVQKYDKIMCAATGDIDIFGDISLGKMIYSIVQGYVALKSSKAYHAMQMFNDSNRYKTSALCFLAKKAAPSDLKLAMRYLNDAIDLVKKNPVAHRKKVAKIANVFTYLPYNDSLLPLIAEVKELLSDKYAIELYHKYLKNGSDAAAKAQLLVIRNLSPCSRRENSYVDTNSLEMFCELYHFYLKNRETKAAKALLLEIKILFKKLFHKDSIPNKYDAEKNSLYGIKAIKILKRTDHKLAFKVAEQTLETIQKCGDTCKKINLICKLYNQMVCIFPEYANALYPIALNVIPHLKNDCERLGGLSLLLKKTTFDWLSFNNSTAKVPVKKAKTRSM